MKEILKEGNTRTVFGHYQILWACPYESKNGRECGRLHWINWDKDFDSPCDGTSLFCPEHSQKEINIHSRRV